MLGLDTEGRVGGEQDACIMREDTRSIYKGRNDDTERGGRGVKRP